MTDLDRRAEIHDLVVTFYREIVFDDLLAPLFAEVAETDWTIHMPKLIDYWCRVLLDQPGYGGWFLEGHRRVHDVEPFTIDHCDRWYELWVQTIDARWSGPLAATAKEHASRMMRVLAHRLLDLEWRSTAVIDHKAR